MANNSQFNLKCIGFGRFLAANLELTEFKSTPSEVAELASMSMELISMEHWEAFFPNADDYKRAKKEQLNDVLKGLPWIASIDKFQILNRIIWRFLRNNHIMRVRFLQTITRNLYHFRIIL